MKSPKRCAALLAAAFTVSANAQITPFVERVWARLAAEGQNTKVFGFELGKPLVLPECRYEMTTWSGTVPRKRYAIVHEQTCSEDDGYTNLAGWPVRHIRFALRETSILAPSGFTTLEKDGLLLGMEFSTSGLELQQTILAQLTERFGKPTTMFTDVVGNKMGARFEAITALWSGGPVDVTYFAAAARLDQGLVIVSLPEGTEIRSTWKTYRRPGERPL